MGRNDQAGRRQRTPILVVRRGARPRHHERRHGSELLRRRPPRCARSQTQQMIFTEERLLAEIRNRGIEAELIRPGAPMPTVPLAAAAMGVAEQSIIKSVLFEDLAGGVVLGIANGTS